MTEAEWLVCNDPQPMLDFLRGKVSDRKLRLFAVACCRHIWHLLEDNRIQRAVDAAERYADGQTSSDELASACKDAEAARGLYESASRAILEEVYADDRNKQLVDTSWEVIALDAAAKAAYGASYKVAAVAAHAAIYGVGYATGFASGRNGPHAAEQAFQAALMRDVFGNPYRSIALDPAWLTWHDGLLVSMARQMYESRDFTDMPILADALEEAGCTNQDILAHCRSGGEHVRGCWVIDLVLGKE